MNLLVPYGIMIYAENNKISGRHFMCNYTLFLNNCKWQLKGFWPNVPLLGKGMELGNELMGITDWIDASVPGGVHGDLIRAGIIEDPNYEMNSLKCEWVENRWWMYRTYFSLNEDLCSRNIILTFKGLDYKAHIYLNGEKLGEHEGMFIPAEFDLSGRIEPGFDNELKVLFEDVPKEMGQIGYTSKTTTQKSRFNYKWDFSTRMVNIGIWDDVVLNFNNGDRITDCFVKGLYENNKAFINIEAAIVSKIDGKKSVKYSVEDGQTILHELNEEIIVQNNYSRINKTITIDHPKLWYPNGYGEQPLYKVKIQISNEYGFSDEKVYFTGVRSLQYTQNENSPDSALPYTIIINGKPVYIKGVNMVPLKLLYGNVLEEEYRRFIGMLKNANVNLVRVWGGGIIEKEYFYNLCDCYGIMVWQEFIQSSSGIDNIPSKNAGFLDQLTSVAKHAVKMKRNHVSHVIWSGGNELTDDKFKPITFVDPNIGLLKAIVDKYDNGKIFLPSSPSGPNEFLDIDDKGSNHDVHGGWKYEGIEKHYKIFNQSDSLLHSEFGVDGCSNIHSLRRFLGPGNLVVSEMKDNMVWRHHGEWWDTLERDIAIFGEMTSLEQFCKASQLIQAEGLRYGIESNRRRKFKNSGSIIWQFNEPWPNVSNTCVVDYYGCAKMAYYWMRNAYSPVHVSLKYEKLFLNEEEPLNVEVFLHNSRERQELNVKWSILDIRGKIIFQDSTLVTAFENTVVNIKKLCIRISEVDQKIFFVKLEAIDYQGNICSDNIYLFSQNMDRGFYSLMHLEQPEIEIKRSDNVFKIKNIGSVVCLFINGFDNSGMNNFIINNNFTCLFPGEEKAFELIPLSPYDWNTCLNADIKWSCLQGPYL